MLQWVTMNKRIKQLKKVKCKQCGNTFTIKLSDFNRGRGYYCKRECYYQSMVGRKRSEKTCRRISLSHMGKKNPNYGKKASKKTRRKMSECREGKIGHNKGKIIEANRGKNHWNWKGGVTLSHWKMRSMAAYRDWRKAVLARDNRCQWCGVEKKLIAHHIIGFSKLLNTQFEELIFEVDNGMTLCEPCHYKIHKLIYKNGNTKKNSKH